MSHEPRHSKHFVMALMHLPDSEAAQRAMSEGQGFNRAVKATLVTRLEPLGMVSSEIVAAKGRKVVPQGLKAII